MVSIFEVAFGALGRIGIMVHIMMVPWDTGEHACIYGWRFFYSGRRVAMG